MEPENPQPTKEVVTVREMASMLGMSASRLYQLVKTGILLPPAYALGSRKPLYPREIQLRNIIAKRTNCGVNGTPVLFYSKRVAHRAARISRPGHPKGKPRNPSSKHEGLMDALSHLGIEGVTVAQLDGALAEAYPEGTAGVSEGEVIRTIFRIFKRSGRQDSAGNAGSK